jgi:hypothetical protein
MKDEQQNIQDFIINFQTKQYADPNVQVQIAAGWFDWFCKETSLVNKTKVLAKKVIQLSKSPKIDVKKNYVFFKNNCPCDGPLYDSFSICDMESGNVLYWITPKNGHSGLAEVFGEGDFKIPLVSGSWKDVKDFFLK